VQEISILAKERPANCSSEFLEFKDGIKNFAKTVEGLKNSSSNAPSESVTVMRQVRVLSGRRGPYLK
jgi:hypothetical protein